MATKPTPLPCLLLACALPVATCARAGERTLPAGATALRVDVVGAADPARDAMLLDWASEAARALLQVDPARFPLARAGVVVQETDSRDPSPVPWGQTLRRDGVSVLLYVRRDAGAAALRGDWTAVHEMSHLLHPWLGRDGRWMAEGLASYYQNVLRARAGMMPAAEAWRRLDAGFSRGRRATVAGVPLSQAGGRAATMRIYWAGAAYWLQADLALRARGASLDAVLAAHARCCLRPGSEVTPLGYAQALDRIDGHGLFERLYRQADAATAFPDLAPAYRALGLSRDGRGTMRLTHGDAGAALREAIARPRRQP